MNPAPGQSPHIVTVHGFMGGKEDWEPVIDRIDFGISCTHVELPGHGQQAPITPDRDMMEVMMDAVCEAIPATRQRPLILAGYSMGGRILLHALAGRQLTCDGLVLVSVSEGLEHAEARNDRVRRDHTWADMLRTKGWDDFLDAWYGQPLFGGIGNVPGIMDRVRHRRKQLDPGVMADVVERMSPGHVPYTGTVLANLSVPVLALAGENDAAYTARIQRWEGLSPNIRAVIVDGCGHSLLEEQPNAVADAMRTWIKEMNG